MSSDMSVNLNMLGFSVPTEVKLQSSVARSPLSRQEYLKEFQGDSRELHEKTNKDHKLRLINHKDGEVPEICNLCRDTIGTFPFYTCDQCSSGPGFFLHYVCGNLKPLYVEAPFFHQEHGPIFDLRPPNYCLISSTCVISYLKKITGWRFGEQPRCDYCFEDPNNYFEITDDADEYTWSVHYTPYYSCKICEFTVSLECATIPRMATCGNGMELEHFSHPHMLKRFNSGVKSVKCTACDKAEIPGGPPLYGCLDPGCNFFLHASCALIPRHLYNHPLHPHPLYDTKKKCQIRMDFSKYFTCHLCCSVRYESFGLTCMSCVGFKMCWKCIATLKRNVVYEGHIHPLYFVEKTCNGDAQSLGRCSGYDTICTRHEILPGDDDTVNIPRELKLTESWMFRCPECDFELHLLCGPLPSTINHDCHIHTLTLLDSLVEDDSGEYCCDVCETERDPKICLYYCKECKYSAHVHCIMSEIANKIRGDLEGVELVPLGKQEYRSIYKTMSTILDGEMADEEKQILKKWYNLDDEGYFTMVQPSKLKQKSKFAVVNYEEIMETLCLTSFTDFKFIEFCKDVEDYNKDRIVVLSSTELNLVLFEVRDYMIPPSLIEVLITLLDKYRDLIGTDSRHSMSIAMKSFVLFILCKVVKRMRATLVKDVTKDLLHEWFHHLKFVTKQGFNIAFALAQWESLVEAFLGFQARRLEEEIPTKLKTMMSHIQQGLEMCEKFHVLSQRSKYMNYCMKKAFESTWHSAFEDSSSQSSSVPRLLWKW